MSDVRQKHIDGYCISYQNGEWVYIQNGTGNVFLPEDIPEADKVDRVKLRADTDLLLIMNNLYEGE